MGDATLRATSERLEDVLRALDRHADPAVRDLAREAVTLLVELYGAALLRVRAALDGPDGRPMLERLAADDVVAPLLAVHGAHPHARDERIARAIDRARPDLALRGVRVTLAGIDESTARVRLDAAPGICQSTMAEMARAIECMVIEAAPELSSVEVTMPSPAPAPSAMIPLSSLRRATAAGVGSK